MAQGFKIQISVEEYKPFFWESQANVETLQKPSAFIWLPYKMASKPLKIPNPVLEGWK